MIKVGDIMTIGVDIDDTITNSSELIIKYVKKFFNTDNPTLISNVMHLTQIEDKLLEFYEKYLYELMNTYTIKENAKEVIDRLRAKGHKIIIITARGYTIRNGIIDITKNYLKEHGINYDKIIFQARSKVNACKENNIDLMIDDSVEVVTELKKEGINAILFTSFNNKDIDVDFARVNSWLEIEEYIDKLNYN